MRELAVIHRDKVSMMAMQSDRVASTVVWGTWLVMTLLALVGIAKYGQNVPLAEDWYFVAPLTEHEPDLLRWLWSQNNEHRVPLPRLILLVGLKITNGDFRVGMVFNVILLSALALAMIGVAHNLRGGRTSIAEGLFPIALLHFGNWPNLFWGWQFSFVLSTVLTCAVLLALVSRQALFTPGAAIVAGCSLPLLPLCGATGLISVPLLAVCLGYYGVLYWNAGHLPDKSRWISVFLFCSPVIALCLTGFYFVGYESPTWNPPNPGLVVTLKTTAQFVALGFGPAARVSWLFSTIVAFGFLFSGVVCLMRAVWRLNGLEKPRALGIIVFAANLVLFALTLGWGRAGYVPTVGLPMRYALLAVPPFCLAFYIWELYGSAKLRLIAQNGLFIGICLLLPFNTTIGLVQWGNWYQKGMQAFQQDLLAGQSSSSLAHEHRDFLIHWWSEDQLATAIEMLRDAGIGSFVQVNNTRVNSKDSTDH